MTSRSRQTVLTIIDKYGEHSMKTSKSHENQMMVTTRSLMGILEKRDANLDGHSAHTQRLAMLLYSFLPWNIRIKIRQEDLSYAALLHDIGKLGIPKEILDKPGKLDDNEWKIMRRHPEISVSILSSMGVPEKIQRIVRYHHERVDGSGYYGLSGREIPVESKILAIVDTYSAVTVRKSYKPARTYEDGIATLRLVAGTQLDEQLVNYFCDIPKHRVEACLEETKKEMDELTKDI